MPDINIYTTGFDLAVDIWDISGAVKPIGNVLVYDDHGGHQSLDAVEALTRIAKSIEYVTMGLHRRSGSRIVPGSRLFRDARRPRWPRRAAAPADRYRQTRRLAGGHPAVRRRPRQLYPDRRHRRHRERHCSRQRTVRLAQNPKDGPGHGNPAPGIPCGCARHSVAWCKCAAGGKWV